ncbi:Hypothetical_protein [Hexamita inflata]|uniref:Hypothetical_protein n=1 Tax=Hexamita inflata TaxID=28002 RepID=A0AA86RCH4_9EUKA|nr:Hypothetical protein HINF_LOCUS52975 [Hexamita inflata]
MNKFAPLADLGRQRQKRKRTYRKILIPTKQMEQLSRLTKWQLHIHIPDGRKQEKEEQPSKSNTSTRQINRQNKFASLNSEDSSSNSGNFSHYQEQPHRKEQNVPESLIKWITSISDLIMFKLNEEVLQNKTTEQSQPKGSQQNQSKNNQINELVKSFNIILNGNQKPKGNSFTGQQNHSSIKQRATTDQNPTTASIANNKTKTMMLTRKTGRNTLGTKQTQSKSQRKFYKKL